MTREEPESRKCIERRKKILQILNFASKLGGIILIIIGYILLALFMQGFVLGYS